MWNYSLHQQPCQFSPLTFCWDLCQLYIINCTMPHIKVKFYKAGETLTKTLESETKNAIIKQTVSTPSRCNDWKGVLPTDDVLYCSAVFIWLWSTPTEQQYWMWNIISTIFPVQSAESSAGDMCVQGQLRGQDSSLPSQLSTLYYPLLSAPVHNNPAKHRNDETVQTSFYNWSFATVI